MTRWDDIWNHLRWLYERAGREYTVSAAKWYEANEPWDLAGITEKVRKAIDDKESKREQDRSHRDDRASKADTRQAPDHRHPQRSRV